MVRIRIIKEDRSRSTRDSLKFFQDHFNEIGDIKYVILYYAEHQWLLNHDLFHQYVIFIGEKAQLWLSGLTWGYYGTGPYRLFKVISLIDPSITYEQIVSLEWSTNYPIMLENIEGRLSLKPFNESAKYLLCLEDNRLPWQKI